MDFRRRLVPDMICLRSFDSAARHENFTRAAEELHLTQSSISRHISELEAQLGITLFRRVRRQVILTPAGAEFHREVEALLRQSERMMVRAVSAGDRAEVLRIAAPPTFSNRWLIPRLGNFVALHPGVQIDLFTYDAPFSLAEESCDLAFHFGEPHWQQGTCHYLCSELVVPVCAPQVLEDMGGKDQHGLAARLASAPLLQNSSRPLQWQEWFNRAGLDDAKSLTGSRFDSFSGAIAAALAGLGVALVPTYLIETELAGGQLCLLTDLPLETPRAYYIVEPEEGLRTALVTSFKSWAFGSVRPDSIRPVPPQPEIMGQVQL